MLVISGVVFTPNNINTAEAQSLSEKKAANNAKKKQTQSELRKVRNEKASIESQIKQIDAEVTATSKEIHKKEEDMKKSKAEIKRLEKEIKELEARIAERDNLLKERVRSMHVNGGAISYLEVLLGAKSFGDFLDRVLALNIIAEQDRTIIEEQKADKIALEENKEELDKHVANLEKRIKELNQLKTKLSEQMKEKEQVLSNVKEKERELETYMVSLEEEAAIIKASELALKREKERVEKNQVSSKNNNVSSSLPISSGMFTRPTTGRVTDHFGTRGGRHYGVDIAQGGDVPVFAAADGTVSRAYYSPTYGNVVFIVHYKNGQVYETVYAHLRSIHVSTGQTVKKGKTLVGYMGNTGRSFGQHLHFEIHKGRWNNSKSNAVNPCSYIKC